MSDADGAVAIASLASGGAGVGRLADGMTVFVPRTAPGDTVRLTALRRKRRFATAQLGEVVSPGPARVEPPCLHFVRDRCGGCQWQHLEPAAQRSAKSHIVGDALRRLGRLPAADPEVVPSPRDYGYRATITLTVRRTASRVIAGFHDAADPSRVFHLEKCWIARDEVDALWRAVRPSLSELPEGEDVRLKLRVVPGEGPTLHVIVEGGTAAWGGAPAVHSAVRAAGLDATIWWRPTDGAIRRMAGPERDPAAASFAQVNPEVAAALRDAVVAAAGDGSRVLDLYGGVGDTALRLARAGRDVVLVEMDERAVRFAEDRARAEGLTMRCITARAEDMLAKLLPADVVIVNPPRTGLGADVTSRLAAQPPSRLVYVSCDPATLARDLVRLGAAAGDLTLRSFDMFPQTSHVETLAVLQRAGAAA